MKPVQNMRDGLACCGEDDALKPDLSVAKDSDVSARQPSLRAHRRANNIVFPGGDMWRACKLTRSSALRNNAPHSDLEMPALIAGNRANVGAIDEDRNGRLTGATDTVGATTSHFSI
jgi:hypothetical protein